MAAGDVMTRPARIDWHRSDGLGGTDTASPYRDGRYEFAPLPPARQSDRNGTGTASAEMSVRHHTVVEVRIVQARNIAGREDRR